MSNLSSDLQKAQSETILDKINEIFISGKFVDPPKKEVGENETVVSEMTNYEKAIFSMIELLREKTLPMIQKVLAEIDKNNHFNNPAFMEKMLQNRRKFIFCLDFLKISIIKRLNMKVDWTKDDSDIFNQVKLFLRSDWKLITLNSKNKNTNQEKPLIDLLEFNTLHDLLLRPLL